MIRGKEPAAPLSASEREWLRVRDHLREHRYDLSVTASDELYQDLPRVAGTPLLTASRWLTAEPIPLERIALDLRPSTGDAVTTSRASTPVRLDGTAYSGYSDALNALAAPAVFENRRTYRLLDAELGGPQPRLSFGLGRYFDGIDTGEAIGHEYAAQNLGLPIPTTQRSVIGNPVDLARRPTNLAISALTIRYHRGTGEARFLLHRRDPAKVGHAGGLYQVVPVGVFQPATDHPDSLHNDFSLWRCLVREFAEELLGTDEVGAGTGPIEYDSWPFAAQILAERRRGAIRTHCLGLGVDPLTLATDLLVVVVIDAPVFDRIFGTLVRTNAEGELAGLSDDGRPGVPFTAAEVERLTNREPIQAAGAAVLASAWNHRAMLLSG